MEVLRAPKRCRAYNRTELREGAHAQRQNGLLARAVVGQNFDVMLLTCDCRN